MNQQTKHLNIGEVAKLSGLPASTLRYYDKRGLIESAGRHGLKRLFHPSTLQLLALITLARNAGFSLDEIQEMRTTTNTELNRSKLLEKASILDKQIKQLKTMSKGLKHAAKCKEADHLECPKFQRILKLAIQNQRKKKKADT